MIILNANDIRSALPIRETIEAMKKAFAALRAGQAVVPMRAHLPIFRHDGATLVMPAFLGINDEESLVVKVVSVFNGNPHLGQPRIQAVVNVLDPKTGQPIALLEGTVLTAIRTAAASGAATDLMARPESRTLAVIGTGVQARTHIEAVCSVRSIEHIWILGRTVGKAEQLQAELAGKGSTPADIRIATSSREALAKADIVCTTTTASKPVFDDSDLPPGVHINAVGSYTPEAREIPSETVVRSRVVVDQREAAWSEAGDLIHPFEAGLIDRDHIQAELGEVVLGERPGRESAKQITFFKSVGIAVQDAAAAQLALANSAKLQLGKTVNW